MVKCLTKRENPPPPIETDPHYDGTNNKKISGGKRKKHRKINNRKTKKHRKKKTRKHNKNKKRKTKKHK